MIYILVCFFTIFISSKADFMYENITGVSAVTQYHYLVVGYTIFCACVFAYKTKKVYHYLYSYKPWIDHLIILTAIIMSFGSFFRYTINAQDLSSMIHVYCSMIPSLIFLVLLFVYNRYLLYQFPKIYARIHWYYEYSVYFLGLLLVVFTRVNGYIEILFAIIVSSYLYIIEKEMKAVLAQKSSNQ